MGGKSLMCIKRIFILVLCVLPLYGDLSINQMKTMVDKIKSKREGIMEKNITIIVSPFVSLKKEHNITIVVDEKPAERDVTFTLGAIVNDKAYINNDWIVLGSEINGYVLSKIENRGVILVGDNKAIHVHLRQGKQIIKISEE